MSKGAHQFQRGKGRFNQRVAGRKAFDINAIQVSSVAAIEVYVDAASIPAQYRRPNLECGASFIGTKGSSVAAGYGHRGTALQRAFDDE